MADKEKKGGGLPTTWIVGGLGIVAIAALAIVWTGFRSIEDQPQEIVLQADPMNAEQVAFGREVYAANCAACHGPDGEGQEGWNRPPASGPRPAPPHNETGHTWHHGDAQLFEITKYGPGQAAGLENYDGGMPSFESQLSDAEIWAVLAYIKSMWPETIRARQHAVSLGEAAAHAHDDDDHGEDMGAMDEMDGEMEPTEHPREDDAAPDGH